MSVGVVLNCMRAAGLSNLPALERMTQIMPGKLDPFFNFAVPGTVYPVSRERDNSVHPLAQIKTSTAHHLPHTVRSRRGLGRHLR